MTAGPFDLKNHDVIYTVANRISLTLLELRKRQPAM